MFGGFPVIVEIMPFGFSDYGAVTLRKSLALRSSLWPSDRFHSKGDPRGVWFQISMLARATHPRSDRLSQVRHCSHVRRVTVIDFDSGSFSAKLVLHPGNWPHYAQGSVTHIFETDGSNQGRLALRRRIVCRGRHGWPRR